MLVVDSHAHLYPCYTLEKALEAASFNLSTLAKEALNKGEQTGSELSPVTRVLVLTERQDCHFYDSLASGQYHTHGYRLTLLRANEGKGSVLMVLANHGGPFYILPGRQVITAERLEILALGTREAIQNGYPWMKALEEIAGRGAYPVLCWSPGKWLFKRGRVVAEILSTVKPTELSIGDTALRPQGFPKPLLMRKAERAGFAVLAGSDPLPVPGEEECLGSYGTLLDAIVDESRPFSSILKALRGQGRIVGRRHHLLKAAGRLIRNWATAHAPQRPEQL